MKPYYQDKYVTIYHGDCREILPELPQVDLVLTDPPYGKEYLDLWDTLGRLARQSLKDGCLLLTLSGCAYVDIVIQALSASLRFYWIGGMPSSLGRVNRFFPKQMMVGWKPCLWFSKGSANTHPYTFDFIETKIDKSRHIWGQPESWFAYYIEKLTKKEDLILDPFLGGGAVCFAAKKLNRHSIGIEIEEKYCEIAARRCSQMVMELR